MVCFLAFPGAAAVYQARLISARGQSSCVLTCLTRTELQHEHVSYRPPSKLKSPSLQRGWILGRRKDFPDSGLEVLLLRPEQEEEEESPQTLQWTETGEAQEHFFEENVIKSNSGGRRSEGLPEEDLRKNRGQPFLTKPKYVRGPDIDRKSFIRVYYISALRVPATECWDLVYELREHLLNWQRVNNIGRVLGDDIDDDLAILFEETPERKRIATRTEIRTAIYAEKLSGKGITGHKHGKHKSQGILGSREAVDSAELDSATMLELVETECEPDEQDSSPSRTFPNLSLSKKWSGPTRLLLLDEKHAGKHISDLPVALQAIYSRFGHIASMRGSGLVNCRLTVFYEYWSMNEVLQELLPAEAHAQVELQRTGHVAELKLYPEHFPWRHLIAQVALDKHKPTVRSVVVRRELLQSKQYAVQLELLAGTSSLVTTAWEHGIPFRIDMASVIWDPRLGSERQRLLKDFSEDDVICDVSAGVGSVAIPASKRVRRVFANDVSPHAHFYLARNVVENNVSGKVEIFNQDVQEFLSKIFYVERPLPITQLVMSHPLATAEFIELFRGAFSKETWPCASLPRIHLWGISGENKPEEDFSKKIADVLQYSTCRISTRRVIEMAGGQWMVYASFVLPADFGFN